MNRNGRPQAKTERNERIRKLREEDRLTLEEIGEMFGISYQRVQQIVGPTGNSKERRIQRANEIINDPANWGRSNADLGRELGLHPTTVARHRKPIPEREKYRRRVLDKSRPEGECLIYQGYIDPQGYPRLSMHGEAGYAYQVMIDVPEGEYVHRTCDNKACVNPDHLYTSKKLMV